MLFPKKFQDIDPLLIRENLFKLYDEGIAREDIGELMLRIKGHFLDEDLKVVVALSTDIFNTVSNPNTIDEFFKYKSNIFKSLSQCLRVLILLRTMSSCKTLLTRRYRHVWD